MHGIKVFVGVYGALAANRAAIEQPSAVGRSAGTSPFSAAEAPDSEFGRRRALQGILGAAASVAFASPGIASALDVDAFANNELANDTKNCNAKLDPKCVPKLSTDEALCQYGQGKAKQEACKQVRASGGTVSSKPAGKSLGGAYAI